MEFKEAVQAVHFHNYLKAVQFIVKWEHGNIIDPGYLTVLAGLKIIGK